MYIKITLPHAHTICVVINVYKITLMLTQYCVVINFHMYVVINVY